MNNEKRYVEDNNEMYIVRNTNKLFKQQHIRRRDRLYIYIVVRYINTD